MQLSYEIWAIWRGASKIYWNISFWVVCMKSLAFDRFPEFLQLFRRVISVLPTRIGLIPLFPTIRSHQRLTCAFSLILPIHGKEVAGWSGRPCQVILIKALSYNSRGTVCEIGCLRKEFISKAYASFAYDYPDANKPRYPMREPA